MKLNKIETRTVIPITVYTNNKENKTWKRHAYKEKKMLSKFVRDIVNQYIDMKNRKILWKTNYKEEF